MYQTNRPLTFFPKLWLAKKMLPTETQMTDYFRSRAYGHVLEFVSSIFVIGLFLVTFIRNYCPIRDLTNTFERCCWWQMKRWRVYLIRRHLQKKEIVIECIYHHVLRNVRLLFEKLNVVVFICTGPIVLFLITEKDISISTIKCKKRGNSSFKFRVYQLIAGNFQQYLGTIFSEGS